ncbi:esterase/lipase family protein [Actinomadura rudentiformis]|nr:GPI inositol-deacylase [Actinomadura rudentiformis]
MRRILVVCVLLLASCVAVVPAEAATAPPPPPPPPPPRANSSARPVYFVPGFSSASSHGDLWDGQWKPVYEAMKRWGWSGSPHVVCFYTNASGCNTRIESGTYAVDLRWLGSRLAWNIYSSFTKYGVYVDVMAHSMGGLIVRAAVTGVKKKHPDFPSHLYIEDVATLGTPHSAPPLATYCTGLTGSQQCNDMQEGSAFRQWLLENPNTGYNYGPDWTLIGSDADTVVPRSAAHGMDAGHYVRYHASAGIDHGELVSLTSGAYSQSYWNYYDDKWYTDSTGAVPTRAARNALYYWKDW